MTAPLARIERLVPELYERGGDARWLADALFRWLEDRPRGATFEAALGVLPMAEGFDPVSRRTELLKAMAARLYPNRAPSAQAKSIATAARARKQHEELIELSQLAAQSKRARWPLCWRRILEILQS